MIDIKSLRERPDHFRQGAAKKRIAADIDRILEIDEARRAAMTRQESLRADQKRIEKESGPQIGRLAGAIKKAADNERAALEKELESLKSRPAALKAQIQEQEDIVGGLTPQLEALLLQVPLPPDDDVPVGASSDDNREVRRWNPSAAAGPCGEIFDTSKSFEQNRGFRPRSHIELVRDLGLADFERGVKMAGARSYVLKGAGMLLHNAALRYAFDFMTLTQGFTALSAPVIVREECMVGTGFFPAGREQAYHIEESARGGGQDLFLTGTGEVGLMGFHQGEILREEDLPLRYTTVSTCFRREAGAAGKDTAGLYRIHQFDKVEQVVICRNDVGESRRWHQTMIGFVETILQGLGLPYRLLECCTGDLGPKNAAMIDIESWMPSRGEVSRDGVSSGAYGETHSASRLYDFQCRRLNMRYRAGGEQGAGISGGGGGGGVQFCHSLNNTVLASPRILIPILEMWQNKDGSVTVPPVLRGYMGGMSRIG